MGNFEFYNKIDQWLEDLTFFFQGKEGEESDTVTHRQYFLGIEGGICQTSQEHKVLV